MNNPKTVEQIKTSKGAYSLTIEIKEDGTARVRMSDCSGLKYNHTEISMRLDGEDLRRIHLLLEDHIVYNGENGSL